MLTHKATEALVHVGQMLDETDQVLAAQSPSAATLGALDDGNSGSDRGNMVASAVEQKSSPAPRGN